jgi:hypothetical protein
VRSSSASAAASPIAPQRPPAAYVARPAGEPARVGPLRSGAGYGAAPSRAGTSYVLDVASRSVEAGVVRRA